MPFAAPRYIFFAMLALCMPTSGSAKAGEVEAFISGKCYEHRSSAGPDRQIILCFESDGSLSGADFAGGHGSEVAATWSADASITINGQICRVTIASSVSMILADCYYQGLWTRRALLPRD